MKSRNYETLKLLIKILDFEESVAINRRYITLMQLKCVKIRGNSLEIASFF